MHNAVGPTLVRQKVHINGVWTAAGEEALEVEATMIQKTQTH